MTNMYIKKHLFLLFFSLFFVSCPKMKDDFVFNKWTKEKSNIVRYLARVEMLDFSKPHTDGEPIVLIPTLEIQGENVRFYFSNAMRVYTNFDSCLRYCGELFDICPKDFPVQISYFGDDDKIVESEISDFNLPIDFYSKIKSYSKICFFLEDIELKITPNNLKVSFEFCVPLKPLNL